MTARKRARRRAGARPRPFAATGEPQTVGAGTGSGSGGASERYRFQAFHASQAMRSAATTRSSDTAIMATAPITLISATPSRSTMVAYRLYAVTRLAATVVTYMNSMGIPA